ncbi:hypothetical protein CLIB1423_41S00496 [[Candida] railenensis]|uniref:Uncharacterized protein n=1 Tax=[Candida] railenensis TaxID=45579 RepID=A0A9P0QWT2_9ASCO|nr:hypothetical protein CLIB1423_41S00496 [[Candida] railenensis]
MSDIEKQVKNLKRSKGESTLRLLVALVLLVYVLFLVYMTSLSVYQDFEYPLLKKLWKNFFVGEITTSTHAEANRVDPGKKLHRPTWKEIAIQAGVHTLQMVVNYFNFLYLIVCSVTIFCLSGHLKSSRFLNQPLWEVVRKLFFVGSILGAFNYALYIAKGYYPLP